MTSRAPRVTAVAAAALALALGVPAAAAAAVRVQRGQTVGDLRVIGQDVRVDGRARGWVIVVDGDLTVGRSGTIGNATIIGGRLRLEPGARVGDEIFQLGGSWPQPDGWWVLLALGLALALRTVVVWLVVALAGLLARRPELASVGAAARTRPLRALAVGALAVFGLSAGSVLLALTLVGLAVAAALWGLLLLAAVVGVAFVLRAEASEPRLRRVVLAALALPVLGDGLLALASAVGLGALLRAAGGRAPLTLDERAYSAR